MYTRRKHPRFPVSGSAVIKTGKDKVEFPGQIEMFSKRGMGIFTDVSIERGTPITLEVNIYTGPDSEKTSLTATVKNFSEWGEKGLLGVEFDQEISAKFEPLLNEYLCQLEKEFITEYGRDQTE